MTLFMITLQSLESFMEKAKLRKFLRASILIQIQRIKHELRNPLSFQEYRMKTEQFTREGHTLQDKNEVNLTEFAY